ncbi:MAG TPA: acyclic terpene utilization AtuA family protein [Tepidisphaeraceae bacterium]|nr:acyclic terpene utilization AtuA family protein [Tepidisphaeraceae bacterium]
METIRIGNASAFWGDSNDAPARLVEQAPDLDYLTLDYLAEVSMSILAKQREREPAAGYARDFVGVVASLARFWKSGRKLRVVTNAGGLNPAGCAEACAQVLRNAGCRKLKIGIVSGDDVLPVIREALAADPHTREFAHMESGARIETIRESLVTANAYIGAAPMVEAIKNGADVVISGRVADPSLTVASCVAHFGWKEDDFPRLAGATVAGHLIECGTQVTGGISTDWLDLDVRNIGYPIVEVSADGSCVVTKPASTGGRVNEQSVKEQLLYELGDPGRYLSPDATVSFLTLGVEDQGHDRVRVHGATGGPPPDQYKVSATYRAGYRAAGMLTIVGRDALAKARRCGQMVLERLRAAGSEPQQHHVECLGSGDAIGQVAQTDGSASLETVLRISVLDPRKEIVERFTREIAPLVTSGPQGTTGYAEGRPPVREVFGYWPTLIPRSRVKPQVQLIEV